MLSPERFAFLLRRLQLETLDSLSIAAAPMMTERHVPPFPPDAPALVTAIEGRHFEPLFRVLRTVYPPAHGVRLVRLPDGEVTALTLEALTCEKGTLSDQAEYALYLPPLPAGSSFEAFQEVVAHLHAPDGCPWDRKQTHQTLRKYLLEESYEALAAMDAGDAGKMREEFGDLLLQIVLNAQIGYESGEFTMTEVLKEIHDKLIRRHPHVFGQVEVDDVGEVLTNWERIKQEERRSRGEEEKSLLDGVPAALPALSQAQEYQARAARVGFDWPEVQGVLEKIREEIEEVRRAADLTELTAEVGDLLFALVNLARWKKVDAEAALRETNQKFRRRFAYIERRARQSGRDLNALTLEEMDAWWNEAKKKDVDYGSHT